MHNQTVGQVEKEDAQLCRCYLIPLSSCVLELLPPSTHQFTIAVIKTTKMTTVHGFEMIPPVLTQGNGNAAGAPQEFHFFEQLPVELQLHIIMFAFLNDKSELRVPNPPYDRDGYYCRPHLHVAVDGNACEVVMVNERKYNAHEIFNIPKRAPTKAPRLFGLFAVNAFFRDEMDLISHHELKHVFQPDFMWNDSMDVVLFNPQQMILKIHFLSEEPDFSKIPKFLSKQIAREATRVQILCSYDVISSQGRIAEDVIHEFDAENDKKPKEWVRQAANLFPNAHVIGVAWWGVGAHWERLRPDSDGYYRQVEFR